MMLIITYTDLIKDKRFVSLQSLIKEETIPVIRGKFGATQSRSVWDLVVGDVIILSAGDRVPADCLVLESSSLMVEEKVPHEEENDKRKTKKSVNGDPFLYADSLVQGGTCKALVMCVGPISTRGAKEEPINTDIDTNLQRKLKNLEGHFTAYAAYSSALIFLVMVILLIIQLSTHDTTDENQPGIAGLLFQKLTTILNFSVVLWMVSVPEGLSLSIGISLAFSVMKMYGDKLLVRKLDAPEKMGQIEEICCGKTGTITTGNMKVAQFHCEKQDIIKNTRKNTLLHCELTDIASKLIQESIMYNCEARIEMDQTVYKPVGNSTEVSLLRFLQDAEIPVHLLIQKKLGGNILAVCPFSSISKRSVTVVRCPDEPSLVTVYIKGAPEIVIGHCKKQLHNGQEYDLEDPTILLDHVNNMASQPLRVITFAFVQMDYNDWNSTYNSGSNPEQELENKLSENQLPFCYIGSFGLRDTLRPRVQSCVQYARDHAKLGVRLVSGDHIETARMIAIKAGILKPEESGKPNAVMLASEFRERVGGVVTSIRDGQTVQEIHDPEAFRDIVHDLRVLARADASDKLTLIVGLQSMNRKVAATGDGINDLAAISHAEVGISMGSGVAAAKEVSDIVLTGDDFEASLRAVMWGRNIYHNITRFLQFQVTVNISLLVILFIGIIWFGQSPITSVQLLWINLIMDIFAALALATEPPLKSVIEGPPYTDNVALLSPTVWRQILGVSLFNILIVVLVMFFGAMAAGIGDYDRTTSTLMGKPAGFETRAAATYTTLDKAYLQSLHKKQHFTYIFNIFVFLNLFNMINCRKIGKRDFNVFESMFHNWYFIFLFAIIGGVQFAGTQYL